MSGWAEGYNAIGNEPPPEAGEPTAKAAPAPAETPETARARADLDAAVAAHRQAQRRLHDGEDALADAQGALRVSAAKAADYDADGTKAEWQRVSAAEGVEKALRGLDRRTQTVQHQQSDVDVAAETVDAASRALDAALTAATESAADEDAPPTLQYPSVDGFVREYLRHVYLRRIDGRHRVWAARWWDYDEALIRLEALWRSWEHLRQDPSTGMSVWWRDHADHHMAVLMDPDGPFAMAADGEENQSRRGQPLPYLPPPEGMF